ncbi:MAG TPA: D-alanyl-D-alanine carboxypeptidase family protein [Burkholderiaceae bacterium]|nr:D-alanyl-D-alanine carboxypeptidase family protein [Burkholderiaceae bacterium]
MGTRSLATVAAGVALAIASVSPSLLAQPKGKPAPQAQPAAPAAAPGTPATQGLMVQGAPQIAARSWLLVDVTTGQLLAASDPDMRVEPASLTKLMTAYLAFNAIREKKLALDFRPPVSPAAHKAIGSRMFVDPAKPATVEELLHGLIVQSGNDAAVILAEALGGSEQAFAQQMNREAQRLAMRNTSFTNASGLPDAQHYSTARDLAILASRLIEEHPEFYKIYSQREYTYNNIKQANRNRLLFIDPTVDGVKTGHTDAAGYCLIASARRDQPGSGVSRRLLSVVLGTASESARAIESQKLLNWGFANFDVVRLYQKDQPAASYEVWKGAADQVKAGFSSNVLVTVVRGQGERVKGEIERQQPLVAPIEKGQRIGTLRVRLEDKVIAEQPLIALEPVAQGGWLSRGWDTMRLWFK